MVIVVLRKEILDPSEPEWLEVSEMADVLLNRPRIAGPADEPARRNVDHALLESARSAAKTLNGLSVRLETEPHLEGPLKPATA